ncbi:WD repeat and HMG-box DNA-binding protein 1-like [Lingula anatina]|uniref:WD repeat and HMG-box DNA-binding protein 1-like n=1 Tax=Lingula anatina TaxID=7574 RepID=A0A1S3HS82_LINAN|nr:WD repeat and HMG-box DNA-binding protein 1-like [Lingula anatina]|eukprot:XP_013388895.1 WD repeat and HMG-box DNA-binding protein 1-like [Lingula anatina]
MPVTKKPLRFSHCEGHTDLCYSDSGRYILTCGADGDVRILDGVEDDDPQSHRIGDKVYSLAYMNDHFYTASDDNCVQVHTFPEGAPDGIVTRFTSPATHMCFNKTGTHMLVGASDFSIKLVELKSSSQKVFLGHNAPVLSIALDCKEEYVASASCDGTVKVWKVADQSCVKTFTILPKANDISSAKTLCRLTWHPKNGKLIVPVDKEVRVYERNTWELSYTLKDDTIKELVSITVFSPCGNYLAVSCIDGWVLIFDFKLGVCVERVQHDKKLTISALAWNPKGNKEIAFCDNQGNLGVLENVIPEDGASANKAAPVVTGDQFNELFDDGDDDMLIQATNQGSSTPVHTVAAFDDDDNDSEIDIGKIKARYNIGDDMESQDGDSVKPSADGDAESVRSGRPAAPLQPQPSGPRPTPLQRPFQPGSTPVHLSQRFMVWNSVGIIKQYNTEEENSLDVEFHDTSVHHAMHLENTMNFTMADMSTEAVVLACESGEENTSTLMCLHFSSWDNNKDWTLPMPKGEEIQAVTVGEGWIAAATDKRNVRIVSVGGVQQEIFSVPGPVVTMAGHSHQLMVVYHMGTGVPGDQYLGVKLMYVRGKKKCVIPGEHLPLSPKATLSWLGFSAEGSPFAVDSSGIVRMLNRRFGSTWMPVANLRSHAKGKSDNFWMVGVCENPEQIRCVPCKGSVYPPTLPRPAVTILPFQLPFCELTTEKGQFEEKHWRNHILTGHYDFWRSIGWEVEEGDMEQARKPMTEALMQLFALSCKADREFRAIELCEMMPSQHAVQLAIKYASRMKRIQLAEKISDVARQKAEEEAARLQQDMEEEEEEEPHFRSVLRPARNKTTTEWSDRTEQDEEEDMEQEDAEEEEEETHSSGPMLHLNQKKEMKTKATIQLSGTRKNPFKSNTKTTPTSARGTSVFDDMKKQQKSSKSPVGLSTEQKTQKKKGPMQMKLFQSKKGKEESETQQAQTPETPNNKKRANPFQLWLEENKSRLEDENPGLEEADFTVIATTEYASLPREEKKKWMEKAKAASTPATPSTPTSAPTTNAEDTPTSGTDKKKRKRDEMDENDQNETTESSKIKNKMDNLPKKKKPLSQSTNCKLAAFKRD